MNSDKIPDNIIILILIILAWAAGAFTTIGLFAGVGFLAGKIIYEV